MAAPTFTSSLATHFRRFIELKRQMGYVYETQELELLYFDRFLSKHGCHGVELSPSIFSGYLAAMSNLHPNTRYRRFVMARAFAWHLRTFVPKSYVPQTVGVRKRPPRRPYLFSCSEISQLLRACRSLPPIETTRGQTAYTIIGLLYATGMRVGEVVALEVGDLYLDDGKILIRKGKLRKARWNHVTPSTIRALREYLHLRSVDPHGPADTPVFVNLRGHRVSRHNVEDTFLPVLRACGIGHRQSPLRPRVHDLRHTFAVHRLVAWYQQGRDINLLLPALATHLGHVSIKSLQTYLHATGELLGEATARFGRNYRRRVLLVEE